MSTARQSKGSKPAQVLTARRPVSKAPTKSGGPTPTWLHRALYDKVIAALHALPGRFISPLVIEGVPATDLFTMNTPLGAAIEASVVDSLNALRQLWDPSGSYASYTFVRQAQTFPDVLLKSTDPNAKEKILLGIELKGWFAIAKEGEPSFRYYASENVCADADLLVVVPWIFDSVISGKPRLLQPIITEARFAAKMRNHHWEFVRAAKSDISSRGVTLAQHRGTYPMKANQYSDRAVNDSGGNFGRIARCGVMNAEVKAILAEPALGIPLSAWQRFLSMFSEKSTETSIAKELSMMESELIRPLQLSLEQRDEMMSHIHAILELVKSTSSH